MNTAKPRVLVIGPVPPPAFGVAEATRLMLDSRVLAERFEVIHLDTSDTLGFTGIGRLNWGNVRLGLRHVSRLASMLRKERPDVVLLTVSQGLLGLVRDSLFVSSCRLYRVRTVAYLRGSKYADLRQEQGRLAAALARSILEHSDRVLVLGESLVDMALRVCPMSRVVAVPNGCPPAAPADQVGLRDDDQPLVLYVGRLSRAKGLEDALAAARTVIASVPATRFMFCGEWDSLEYQMATRTLVEKDCLVDATCFPGPISAEERARLLAQAWVLIVPSHSEGQPWAILEAMSAGVPVVATDSGAIAETVGNGLGGYVSPVGDSDALAQGLTRLLSDDSLWRQMSQEATRRYQERFTLVRAHSLLSQELWDVANEPGESTAEWFSDNAARFDEQYGRTAFFADRCRLWARLIDDSCGPRSRVLDVGCGSGVFTALAAQHKAEVVAADPSPKMLDLCMRRCAALGLGSCTFLQRSVEELEADDLGLFDLTLASSVLEYVDDLQQCLAILGRLSRAGATLVASIPNSVAPRRLVERFSYRMFRHPKYFRLVKNVPTLQEFQTMLADAGFISREVHYYGLNSWLRRWSRRHSLGARLGTMVAVVATKL